MNDWCLERDYDVAQTGDLIRSNGHLNTARFNAFMLGYQSVRPLLPIETLALPMMARAAAFRFWVSRLNDWYKPRSATQLIPHDPAHFERVLRSRRENAFLI
jgi:homoserine kinase type II